MTRAPVPSLTDEALAAAGRTFALGWLEQRALVAAGRWRDAASASGAQTPAQQHTWRERWERLNGPVVETTAHTACRDAARAAWGAAGGVWDVAGAALRPTVDALQDSSLDLLARMADPSAVTR